AVVACKGNSGSEAASTSVALLPPVAARAADSFSTAADPNSCNSASGIAVADGTPDRNAMEPGATNGPVVVRVQPPNVERAEPPTDELPYGATTGRDYGLVPDWAPPSLAVRHR